MAPPRQGRAVSPAIGANRIVFDDVWGAVNRRDTCGEHIVEVDVHSDQVTADYTAAEDRDVGRRHAGDTDNYLSQTDRVIAKNQHKPLYDK